MTTRCALGGGKSHRICAGLLLIRRVTGDQLNAIPTTTSTTGSRWVKWKEAGMHEQMRDSRSSNPRESAVLRQWQWQQHQQQQQQQQ